MDDIKTKLLEIANRQKPKCNCFRCTGYFYQEHFTSPVPEAIKVEQERRIRELMKGLEGNS
jgi:hypothetical protein